MEIRCAEAPQFSDTHRAYLAFTCETLECFGMDLQRCRGFARIEESLEMRKGWLTGVAACISLIKPSTARVGTGLKSPCCLMVGCGVRLPSTDFEPIHYSAGVNLRVIGGREHIRRNRTRRICCFLSENLLSRRLRKNLSRSARRTSSTFRYAFRESKGTDH